MSKAQVLPATIISASRSISSMRRIPSRMMVPLRLRMRWETQLISPEAIMRDAFDCCSLPRTPFFSWLTSEASSAEEEPQPEEESAEQETDEAAFSLSEDELRLLRSLLHGEELGWLREKGLMLSVLTDSINEKLFDEFVDTVPDDTPDVIEEYRRELKEILRL